MRILVLTPTFLPAVGGAELVILQVYRRLAMRHSVLVLTPYLTKNLLNSIGSKEYNHFINFGVQRYHDRLTLMKIRGHRVTCGLIPPFSLSAIAAVKRAVRAFNPDIINIHYVMPTGLAGFYAQKILKIPVVITYNGRDVPGPGVPVLWKYWHRFIGYNCADMTFVSNYCRNVIYGSTAQLGQVIYNGVEDPVAISKAQVDALQDKLQLFGDEHILFSLQRLDYLKRIDVLIRSMPKILEYEPKTYLIIGGKGSDLPRLKNLTDELGIAERVIFAGFIPDIEVPIYFTLADLYVFHSTYETFGMVLAEAMNYGKAIVSVANTAIPEVVDTGKTGLLVPTYDSEALAGAILQLLNNRNRREEMGKWGKKRVERLFRWDDIALKYEQVLKAAISE